MERPRVGLNASIPSMIDDEEEEDLDGTDEADTEEEEEATDY